MMNTSPLNKAQANEDHLPLTVVISTTGLLRKIIEAWCNAFSQEIFTVK